LGGWRYRFDRHSQARGHLHGRSGPIILGFSVVGIVGGVLCLALAYRIFRARVSLHGNRLIIQRILSTDTILPTYVASFQLVRSAIFGFLWMCAIVTKRGRVITLPVFARSMIKNSPKNQNAWTLMGRVGELVDLTVQPEGVEASKTNDEVG
jgi:hypothetical protein